MTTVLLDDGIYKELFILTKSEYDAIDEDYKAPSIFNRSVKTTFLPGHGTVLFFENRHFLIISEKEPVRKYAVWRNHKIIGYCDITRRAAEKANKANNAVFYFEPAAK